MKEIPLNIFGRKIQNMDEVKRGFADLRDGRYMIIIKDIRKRTLSQNGYYWAVVCPLVQKGLHDAGFDEVQTTDDAHEVMKHIFLKKKIVNKNTCDEIVIAGSSAVLTTPEFNEYIERICRWAYEYLGLEIPTPSRELALFAEWEKNIIDGTIET